MLRTLIVGLGRAGLGLHAPVLRRLRSAEEGGLYAAEAPVAVDPAADPRRLAADGLVVAGSLEAARRLLDPARTVVHVCTPPSVRLDVLTALSELGFRKLLVEKPLATDRETLQRIGHLRDAAGLELVVVAHWLGSALTCRLAGIIHAGTLGQLREISFVQRKSRYGRTQSARGSHPSAFDVELPHSVGVALELAGGAEVIDAGLTDMEVEGRCIAGMGGAHLVLRHAGGAVTRIVSDLTSPVRERRVRLDFRAGSAEGHYPVGQEDNCARLEVTAPGQREAISVFEDDSLATFFSRAYWRFLDPPDGEDHEFELNREVVSLLCDAKEQCARRPVEARAPQLSGIAEHA